MSFLESPGRYVRTARTSRDVCRDSVAIEPPDQPKRGRHQFLVGVGMLVGLFLFVFVLIGATL